MSADNNECKTIEILGIFTKLASSTFLYTLVAAVVVGILTIGTPDIIDGFVYKLTNVKTWKKSHQQNIKHSKPKVKSTKIIKK